MPRLQKLYKEQVIPKMKAEFGYKNNLAVPKALKVVINIGTGRTLKDPKLLNIMINNLKKISGQVPVKTKSKKAIAGFGIKVGMVVGLKITLRKKRMYDFLDKLANVVLPRVRDFKGLSVKSFDKNGNYTIGFREQISFPELHSDEVEKTHGLEVCINTTAKTNKEGAALLKYLGFPFGGS
jgi:large subunit ribosomal protein L5